MIKHIVMWNFADEAEGDDKATNLAKVQQDLVALRGLVPGMGAFEIAIGADPLEHTYDMVLYSEFLRHPPAARRGRPVHRQGAHRARLHGLRGLTRVRREAPPPGCHRPGGAGRGSRRAVG